MNGYDIAAVISFVVFALGFIITNKAKDPPTAYLGILIGCIGFVAMIASFIVMIFKYFQG